MSRTCLNRPTTINGTAMPQAVPRALNKADPGDEEQRHLQLWFGEVSRNPNRLADGASATASPRPDVGATPTKGQGYGRFASLVAGTRINPR